MSVVDHPDRLAGLSGEQRGVDREDRRVLLLAAEPAARLRLDDLRLLVVEPERALQCLVDVVRALERAVDRNAAVLAGYRDHRVVLDVELLLVADAVRSLEHEIGLREARVEVAGRDLVMGEDVVAYERVEDGGEFFRPHGDPAAGGPQRLAIGGGQEQERLCVVLDLAADRYEDRLIVADETDDVVAGDVPRGDDGDLRPVERGVEVDRDEPGVGVGRTDRRPEPGAGEHEIVGVLRLARKLVGALAAERGSAAGTARRDLATADDEGVRGAPAGCDRGGGPAGRRPDRHAARVDPPRPRR